MNCFEFLYILLSSLIKIQIEKQTLNFSFASVQRYLDLNRIYFPDFVHAVFYKENIDQQRWNVLGTCYFSQMFHTVSFFKSPRLPFQYFPKWNCWVLYVNCNISFLHQNKLGVESFKSRTMQPCTVWHLMPLDYISNSGIKHNLFNFLPLLKDYWLSLALTLFVCICHKTEELLHGCYATQIFKAT